MKKYIYIFVLFFVTLFFSGCDLVPQKEQVERPDFVLSQSIWKSIDGGLNWEVKNIGEGKPNTTKIDILSFAINPFDKNNIYAGLRSGGILETNNGGETWRFINYQSEKVYGLVLDPRDGKTLYASGVWKGRGKMFKTQNEGVEWKEIYTSPADGPLIISLTIDKKNPDVLYATTSEREVIKSTDAGVSWKNIHLAKAPVLKVAIDAGNSNLIYFVSNDGNVFRSTDGGKNFENIASEISSAYDGISRSGFSVLETSPSVANQVFLAGTGGIISSDDGGKKWKKITALNDSSKFPIKAMAINPRNSREIIYAMAQATYKSTDGGKNWATSQFNNKMNVNILKYDPSGSGELFVGFTK